MSLKISNLVAVFIIPIHIPLAKSSQVVKIVCEVSDTRSHLAIRGEVYSSYKERRGNDWT